MQIDITGHHVDVTPALRTYVTEKMQKLVRHSDQVMSMHVILNVEKLQQLAEATVNLNGNTIFATVTATTCTPLSTNWWINLTVRYAGVKIASPTISMPDMN